MNDKRRLPTAVISSDMNVEHVRCDRCRFWIPDGGHPAHQGQCSKNGEWTDDGDYCPAWEAR